MLPSGMKTLTDPCLPDSWNVYGAYAGLFAMLAALTMQLIEFIAHQQYQSLKTSPISNDTKKVSVKTEQAELHISVVESVITPPPVNIFDSVHHCHGTAFQDDIHNHKISTYLLEFGIALHSVLIGLALGTTTESFAALFIALSFHQFFEAVALGAQIARLEHISLRSAIYMVIFFALTTPVGIGIGIGIHSTTYNPKSTTSLLVNGILDSISGGILIYVALINLITAEMGVGAHTFHSLSKRLKLLYFVALYAGVAAMSVIGRWA
jgi:zinc transporter 1/2/3